MCPLRCHVSSLARLSGNAMNAGDAMVRPRSGKCLEGHPLRRRLVRKDAQYALGGLLARLQIWLPCIHRYAKVSLCIGPPQIARVEPHSIEPLRILPLVECVGVREDVAAV